MSDYHKKSIKEKEYANRQHGLPNRCHECDMAVPPEDVQAHFARCVGRAPAHPNARWVSHKQAIKLGVSKKELSELTEAGIIRTKGETGQRGYLLRDVAKALQSKASRAIVVAAKGRAKGRRKGGPKGLTKKPPGVQLTQMDDTDKEFADKVGGFAQAGRTLDTPAKTLIRAAGGEKLRKSTRHWIESALRKAA